MKRRKKMLVALLFLLFLVLFLYELLSISSDEGGSFDAAHHPLLHPVAQRVGYKSRHLSLIHQNLLEQEIERSEDEDLLTRSEFQQLQVKRYCKSVGLSDTEFLLPRRPRQVMDLWRHILFDDVRKYLYCHTENNGSASLKQLLLLSVGALPHSYVLGQSIKPRHLEEGMRRASFMNSSLQDSKRLQRIKDYFKFTFVRNPLERLLFSYLDNIQEPFCKSSNRFPHGLKQEIFERYRPIVYQHWIDRGGSYNISITFSEFIDYYIESFKEHLNPHIKPYTALCLPCRIKYHFYGRYNALDTDVMMVVDHLEMNLDIFSSKHFPFVANASSLLETYYGRLTRMQRAQLYDVIRDELLFYYHLYPIERNSHVLLLDIDEDLYQVHR